MFVEANVPLLRGLPFIEELTLDGSARAFEYDFYGSDSVWKAGLNWQVIPSVRIRGTQGTSYRAPALYELFLGNLTPSRTRPRSIRASTGANSHEREPPHELRGGWHSGATIPAWADVGADRFRRAAAQASLEAETSEAQTLGLIWTPDFLDLSIAVDYFDIVIEDQVAPAGRRARSSRVLWRAGLPERLLRPVHSATPATHPTAPYVITTVNDSYINVNSQSTRGIDITLRYEHEFDFGDLSIDVSATHTMEDVVNLCSTPTSRRASTPTTSTARSAIRNGLAMRRSSCGRAITPIPGSSTISGRRTTRCSRTTCSPTISVARRGYQLDRSTGSRTMCRCAGADDQLTVTGGISNVFNAQPPVISMDGGQRLQNYALAATQYDLRGRTFFVRLGYEF